MSTSESNNNNSGKPTGPEKPNEAAAAPNNNSNNSPSQQANFSDYIGLPKAQAVHSYVKSMYSWICGPAATNKPQASPDSSSTANVTLAAGGHRKLAVHPSQSSGGSKNLIAINKTLTANGEPLSAGPSAEGSDTTETRFSDLSTTPSEKTLASTKTGKPEKEEDSWGNLKDVKSENETMILSTKSNTDISKDLNAPAAAAAAPPAAIVGVEGNNKSVNGSGQKKSDSDHMEFTFMKQLRELEGEKTKEFVVPDEQYFGNRESAPPVHEPTSHRLSKPQQQPGATSSLSNVKNLFSYIIPTSSTAAAANNNGTDEKK